MKYLGTEHIADVTCNTSQIILTILKSFVECSTAHNIRSSSGPPTDSCLKITNHKRITLSLEATSDLFRQPHLIMLRQPQFPFKRNRLRCVRCVNENRKKRKRLRWQAANHGCHCFDRALLLAGACVCCANYATHATQAIAFEWKPGFTLTYLILHVLFHQIHFHYHPLVPGFKLPVSQILSTIDF